MVHESGQSSGCRIGFFSFSFLLRCTLVARLRVAHTQVVLDLGGCCTGVVVPHGDERLGFVGCRVDMIGPDAPHPHQGDGKDGGRCQFGVSCWKCTCHGLVFCGDVNLGLQVYGARLGCWCYQRQLGCWCAGTYLEQGVLRPACYLLPVLCSAPPISR